MHENVLRAQIQDTGSATEIIRRTSHGWASWASEQPLARMVQSATKLRARSILDPVGEKKMKSYLVRVGHLCSPGIKRNLSSNSAYRWRICEDKRPHNFLCLNHIELHPKYHWRSSSLQTPRLVTIWLLLPAICGLVTPKVLLLHWRSQDGYWSREQLDLLLGLNDVIMSRPSFNISHARFRTSYTIKPSRRHEYYFCKGLRSFIRKIRTSRTNPLTPTYQCERHT